MWVLDASVAVKWFFLDEEGHEHSKLILKKLINKPDEFYVPKFFYLEFASVCTKKADHEFAKASLGKILDLGIQTLPHSKLTLFLSLDLAKEYSLSVYDATYVALAHFLKARWLTADEKALKKIPKSLASHFRSFR